MTRTRPVPIIIMAIFSEDDNMEHDVTETACADYVFTLRTNLGRLLLFG